LAVPRTTNTVHAGYTAARERIHRLDVRVQMLTAHQIAHARCRPGIAAYWLATDATGPEAQLPQV
jgi:hypothetical protein